MRPLIDRLKHPGLTSDQRRDMWEAARALVLWQWQPIETAPRDGTEFLAFHPCGAIWHVTRDEHCPAYWSAARYDIHWDEDAFTHWMPLPSPPSVSP